MKSEADLHSAASDHASDGDSDHAPDKPPDRPIGGSPNRAPDWADFLALSMISAAALAFEILLVRLFRFSQGHHFASLAVSLALLGFGAAGTALALLGKGAERNSAAPRQSAFFGGAFGGDALFCGALLASAAGMAGVLALNQKIQLRPMFIAWDAREAAKLLALDFAAFIPFFAAALAIGQMFARWPAAARKLYGVNLIGSGTGVIGAAGLLVVWPLERCLAAAAALAWIAGIVFVANHVVCRRSFRTGARAKSECGASRSRGDSIHSGAKEKRECGASRSHNIFGPARAASKNFRAAGTAAGTVAGMAAGMALGAAALMGILAIGFVCWGPIPEPRASDFSRLAKLLDLPDAKIIRREHGLRGMATEIRSDSLRIAPGLSLQWTGAIPPADTLVLDADRMVALPREGKSHDDFNGFLSSPRPGAIPALYSGEPPAYRNACLSAAPFTLLRTPPDRARALVLGTAECPSAWLAAERGLRRVVWVESNPQITRALLRHGFNSIPYSFCEPVSEAPRHFLAIAPPASFDLVLVDAAATAAGDAASEEPLLTVEGFRAMSRCLAPGGWIALALPLHNPPRYFPKCLLTIRAAYDAHTSASESSAQGAPLERRLVILRSMQEILIMISECKITPAECAAARQFAEQWGFDMVWLPGLAREEANRFHQFPEPVFFDAARAILQPGRPAPDAAKAFTSADLSEAAQWYSLAPATDMRPYFWRSVRWGRLPALARSLGRQGLVYMDWPIFALALALGVSVLLAAALILLPLGRIPPGAPPISRTRAIVYFGAIGFGYMFLEMTVFQRMNLMLDQPVLSAAIVFSVFLIGSGAGSLGIFEPARGECGSGPPANTIHKTFLMVGIWSIVAFALIFVVGAGGGWFRLPETARAWAIAAAAFPMAWALGRPFPRGLERLRANGGAWIPWAWGINGFAGVAAAPAAALLAIEAGHAAPWIAAAACYLAAALASRKWSPAPAAPGSLADL